MAWEWVAPAATAAGVSVGAVTTWLTARGGRTHAEKVAQESNRHTEQMATTDRLQKRLADAYIDLLQMVERSGHWARRIYPMMDTDPPQPVPDLPSADEQIRIRALVRAYGSDEVYKLLGEYVDIINDMLTMAGIIAEEQADRSVPNPAGPKLELDSRRRIHMELRPSEFAKRKQIGEQVSRELRMTPS